MVMIGIEKCGEFLLLCIDNSLNIKSMTVHVRCSTVKRVTQYLETKHQEAYIRQEYMLGIFENFWDNIIYI